MTSLSPFTKFRVVEKAKKGPVRAIRTRKSVLAFDQSLSATGWAYLADGEIEATGTLKSQRLTDVKGFEEDFQRGLQIYRLVKMLLSQFNPSVVVHEMPMVGTKRPGATRSDSAAVAATVIRLAAFEADIPAQMFHAQQAKKHLTGNRYATKPEVKEAVAKAIALPKRTNSHVIDAIALTFLIDPMLDNPDLYHHPDSPVLRSTQ